MEMVSRRIPPKTAQVRQSQTTTHPMKPHTRYLPSLLRAALLLCTAAPVFSQDWWSQSDADFAKQYAAKATGSDLVDQSRIAWMLFGRVSQPTPYQTMQITQWEGWPSDGDTFQSQQTKSFLAVGKVRTRPHLQSSKTGAHALLGDPNKNVTQTGGEEVTRNMTSYTYIRSNKLNTKAGVAAFLGSKKPKQVQFPLGTVEVKATWVEDSPQTRGGYPDAYTFVSPLDGSKWYLTGLHIMAKFIPTAKDAFTSPAPSWLWTTFEYKGNPGLDKAKSFLLPTKDNLNPAEAQQLLADSGVLKAFPNLANYVCNGTQTSFVDSQGSPVLLGNTQLEVFGFTVPTPAPADPTNPKNWTSWKVSCHTCHAEASAKLSQGSVMMQPFVKDPFKTSQQNIGLVKPELVQDYTSFDFNWAIMFHAQ
jgi:hypothetical protein